MTYRIDRAAVIGAGTMGAAIAAHLANVGIPVYLLDIVPDRLTPDEEKRQLSLAHPAVRNRIVKAGFERMKQAKPANFVSEAAAERVTLGNLEDNFDWVGQVDLIIEAIIEHLPTKQALMARIETTRKPGSIVTSNTSGLPISAIAEGRSADFKAHFLGTHFFNPPRYLRLLEVIPTADTSPEVRDFMVRFGERTLGKGVVVCKDTPNFIGNRLMSISAAYALNYVLENGYTVEEIDAITGPLVGRPKTATFRLMDLVGIDVSAFVARNLYDLIPHDPYREILRAPKLTQLRQTMMERGWLGNKSGQGFYKEMRGADGQREFWTLDLNTLEYNPPQKVRFDSVGQARNIEDLGERLRILVNAQDRAGQYLWATLSHFLGYSAEVLPEIADDLVALDNAIKWGFAHAAGPFEIWDMLGVRTTAGRMEREDKPVAPWVKEMLTAGYETFYQRVNGRITGYYDFKSKGYQPLQPRPNVIVLKDLKATGKTIKAGYSASLIDLGDGVACVEFHAKANALDQEMFEMIRFGLDETNRNFEGLVIGNQGDHFCAGANIFNIVAAAEQGLFDELDKASRMMQDLMMDCRYHPKPVVVAPFGMTLGGGAEVAMSGARICASIETYMGLVEVGVGIIPAGGGCKEMVRRVVTPVMRTRHVEVRPFLQRIFEQIGLARVSTSGEEAREMGFLTECDRVIANPDHLLAEARRTVLQLVADGYRPPARAKLYAAGRDALATLELAVYSMQQGGYASEHDAKIARKLAYILCGGDLSSPQWVDEQYFLDLEREAFLSLAGEPKTRERLWHMLRHGKPLRN